MAVSLYQKGPLLVKEINDELQSVRDEITDISFTGGITVADTAPSSPVTGQLWVDTSGDINPQPVVFSGAISVSDTAPSSPVTGQLWVDTT